MDSLDKIKENLCSKLGDIDEKNWLHIDAAIDQAFDIAYDIATSAARAKIEQLFGLSLETPADGDLVNALIKRGYVGALVKDNLKWEL